MDDPFFVGSRLLYYYRNCLQHAAVGAIVSNDDWGFKTQTLLNSEQLRKFVFPWHRQIVAAAHAAGRPAILHSCGQLQPVMDDIVNNMRFDGKHSYEDNIQPVEEAYSQYHKQIAILGGIDVDFVCRAAPEEIYQRAKSMLALTAADGAYALGTGNSVPEYVPDANYFALLRAALDSR
jgi:uroporphyrinogen decarboxylase